MVRGLCPRDFIRWAVDARRAHRGWRGCNRSRSTSAPNLPRRSHSARGVEDAAPYGGCETYAAAHMAMCAVCPRHTNGARAVPAGLHMLGGGQRLAHRGRRGCFRSRRPSAPTLPRRSRDHGAPRTVHPTSSSETGLAAYGATGVETIPKLPAHPTAPLKRTLSHNP